MISIFNVLNVASSLYISEVGSLNNIARIIDETINCVLSTINKGH